MYQAADYKYYATYSEAQQATNVFNHNNIPYTSFYPKVEQFTYNYQTIPTSRSSFSNNYSPIPLSESLPSNTISYQLCKSPPIIHYKEKTTTKFFRFCGRVVKTIGSVIGVISLVIIGGFIIMAIII